MKSIAVHISVAAHLSQEGLVYKNYFHDWCQGSNLLMNLASILSSFPFGHCTTTVHAFTEK